MWAHSSRVLPRATRCKVSWMPLLGINTPLLAARLIPLNVPIGWVREPSIVGSVEVNRMHLPVVADGVVLGVIVR